MKMAVRFGTIIVLVMIVSPEALIAAPRYAGSDKCKICHNRKDQVSQFDIWSKSGHARAYATLATDKAKQFAAKAGVKGDPQKAAECLECHVTGYGEDSTHFAESFARENGVQCESCHGPGSDYKSPSIMSSPKYASNRAGQHTLAVNAGLVMPDEKTCVRCHNKRSPAFKGFVFKDYYEKITHQYKR